jgi:hypothetical protein
MAEELRRIALPVGMSTSRTDFSQALCHCFDCRKTFDKLDLTTDDSGYLDLIHPVSSLATASFTLRLSDGSTSTIDPSGNVAAALSGMNKSDLGSATYVDADGKTQNLVATGTSDEAVMGVAKRTPIAPQQTTAASQSGCRKRWPTAPWPSTSSESCRPRWGLLL